MKTVGAWLYESVVQNIRCPKTWVLLWLEENDDENDGDANGRWVRLHRDSIIIIYCATIDR